MFRRVVLVLAYLFLPVMAFAVCDHCKLKERIYVQLDDLFFDSNGIWFKNGEGPVITGAEAIHIDSLGYYMAKEEQTWLCPKCGKVNPGKGPGFWGCPKCGWPFNDT